jgi:hypothetical protein
MNKFAATFCLLLPGSIFGQNKDKVDGYLSVQYNTTVHDRTLSNNRNGVGLGVELLLNSSKWIRPALQVNGSLFGGTKELRMTIDGKPVVSKEAVSTFFGGFRLDAGKCFFSSLTTGAAIYNGKAHFGFRPCLGFYFSNDKKATLYSSYTNIYQRDEISTEPFGYVSFALALKFL